MRTLKMIRQLKLKKYRLLFWNENMPRFAELSESDLSSLLEEKDAENTKKTTKVKLFTYMLDFIKITIFVQYSIFMLCTSD
jgi:hypothetical protein